jgi:hypothetical protein
MEVDQRFGFGVRGLVSASQTATTGAFEAP